MAAKRNTIFQHRAMSLSSRQCCPSLSLRRSPRLTPIALLQVFHEGLKSWSCCNLHKQACPWTLTTFSRFPYAPRYTSVAFLISFSQGCAQADAHTTDSPAPAKPAQSTSNKPAATSIKMISEVDKIETYGTAKIAPSLPVVQTPQSDIPIVEEEDDPICASSSQYSLQKEGAAESFSSTTSRVGWGTARTRSAFTIQHRYVSAIRPLSIACLFHASQPLFREGSKVCNLCCLHHLDLTGLLGVGLSLL